MKLPGYISDFAASRRHFEGQYMPVDPQMKCIYSKSLHLTNWSCEIWSTAPLVDWTIHRVDSGASNHIILFSYMKLVIGDV